MKTVCDKCGHLDNTVQRFSIKCYHDKKVELGLLCEKCQKEETAMYHEWLEERFNQFHGYEGGYQYIEEP